MLVRPFVYLLTVTVRTLNVSADDLHRIGLTGIEVDFLKPFIKMDKISRPKQIPTAFDAELFRPEFSSVINSELRDKFIDSYLTIKRGVDSGMSDMHKEHLLAMCFCMARRSSEGTVTPDLTITLKDCLLSMSLEPSRQYLDAVNSLSECFCSGSVLINCA